MIITIYCLKDPRNNDIRYIGRTKNKLSYRLSDHISESYSNHGTYKKHWIKSMQKDGVKPIIEPLKVLNCSWEESHEIEVSIISEHIAKGCKLTNLVDRGPGNCVTNIRKGLPNKYVLQYSLEGLFIKEHTSLANAGRDVNGRLKGIWKAASGATNSAYGFQWRYRISENYELSINSVNPKKRTIGLRKVDQYTIEGVFIKTWNSITEAEEYTKSTNIGNACSGKQNTCAGFIWKRNYC